MNGISFQAGNFDRKCTFGPASAAGVWKYVSPNPIFARFWASARFIVSTDGTGTIVGDPMGLLNPKFTVKLTANCGTLSWDLTQKPYTNQPEYSDINPRNCYVDMLDPTADTMYCSFFNMVRIGK